MLRHLLSFFLLSFILACTPQKKALEQPIDLIPFDAQIVLQVNEPLLLKNALEKNAVLGYVKNLFKEEANQLEKLAPKSSTGFLLCSSPIGKATYALTRISTLQLADSIPPKAIATKMYENIAIATLQNDPEPLYRAVIGNQEVVSTSSLVIENSIRNYKTPSPSLGKGSFKRQFNGINPNASFNLLLHPESRNYLRAQFNSAPLFPNINSSWVGFDVATENAISADGVAFLSDSIPDQMRLFKNLERREIQTVKYVPNSFSAYYGLPISNLQQLQENLTFYNRILNAPKPKDALSIWPTVDELGLLEFGSGAGMVLHRNNTEMDLEGLAAAGAFAYRNVSYGKGLLPDAWHQLSRILGSTTPMQWYAYIEDSVLLASDQATIKAMISNYKDGNTLTANSNFQALQESLASKSAFLWVLNTQIWAAKNKGGFPASSFPFTGLQGVNNQDFMLLHLQVQPLQKTALKNTVQQQHSLSINSTLVNAPQWLKNHRTKGMDVVLQDEQNVLYLFSNKGVLFWKKQLPGKIIGPIVQVDLYKNKRLQMAFRTENRFMVLDRNGKIVAPFNIKIPDGNSPQALSVFDYDNNRNYRFIVNYGKKLRMYDNKGEIVKGFVLNTLPSPMRHPAKHIQFNRKDYLLFPLQNETLKIVDRRGQDRIKVKEQISFSDNEIFSYLNTFTTSDQKGALVQVDTKGNVVRSNLDLVAGHRIAATSKSLVTRSENILTIKGIPVQLPFGTYTPPKIFYLNNTLYISTTDTEAQKVYLFYSNGKPVGGFPVYGTGSADLNNADKDKALELLVPAEDNSVLLYQFED